MLCYSPWINPIFKFNSPNIATILDGKQECKPCILSSARSIKRVGHKLKGELFAVTSALCLQKLQFAWINKHKSENSPAKAPSPIDSWTHRTMWFLLRSPALNISKGPNLQLLGGSWKHLLENKLRHSHVLSKEFGRTCSWSSAWWNNSWNLLLSHCWFLVYTDQ